MIIIIKATESKSETVPTQIRIGSSLPQPENSVGDTQLPVQGGGLFSSVLSHEQSNAGCAPLCCFMTS